MTEEAWGPWIEHDGKGCPCVGQWVIVQYDDDVVLGPVVAGSRLRVPGGSWLWENQKRHGLDLILRYRIRRPKALQDLIEMVENLPAPVQPKVDA